jgi:hypothetical protein
MVALSRDFSTSRPDLRAGTHNPWPSWLKKASTPAPKRDDTAYGSRRGGRDDGLTRHTKIEKFRAQTGWKTSYTIALSPYRRGEAHFRGGSYAE